jgi:hypothetical protein
MMRFGKGTVSTLACAAAIVAGGSLALGSTFLKVDIPTLRGMSEAVVRAHVVDVRSSWNDEGSAIFTYVTLEVKGRLSGRTDNELVVRVPGGTVGNFTSVMEGAPEFTVGDDIVAFIARWDDGAPMIAGYAEGVSTVKVDGIGNAVLHGGLANGMPISELTKQLGRSGR